MSLTEVDRSRLAWWLGGALLFLALVFVVYSFVGTFVFGVFIYYATRPVYRRIRRRVGSPSLAAAVSIFALVLPALGLVAYALAIVSQELLRIGQNTPFDPSDYGVDPELLDAIADPATLFQSGLVDYLSFGSVSAVIAQLGAAAGTLAVLGIALVHLFVMLALAFYLLRDDHTLSRWFLGRFGDAGGVVESYARAVDRDFNSIFFGNILNAALTGTIGVIAYSLLNVFAPEGVSVPAPALVGLLAGVASLIPVVGMKLVYVPVALYMAGVALVGPGSGAIWFVVAFALLSFVVVDTIPDLVLRPYVSGRSLHVGAVMIAYTFGPLLFGWYGIFLMPMLLVLFVHFAQIVLPELMAGERIQPYALDPSYLVDDPVASDEATPPAGEPANAGDGRNPGHDPTPSSDGGEETTGDESADRGQSSK
ncbi:AI-2E family transporter [Halobium salinum]|uniref:AI-2E family transporter n=1 Tax=Halobium salinum TaxID=1364940 RepID=A0ABD5PE32_9EURY|nr:AI-2E family transporter [Halobium salinum]